MAVVCGRIRPTQKPCRDEHLQVNGSPNRTCRWGTIPVGTYVTPRVISVPKAVNICWQYVSLLTYAAIVRTTGNHIEL